MLEFPTQTECERARATIKSWLKFDSFKVIATCQKQS
jgi:hypothetical protein